MRTTVTLESDVAALLAEDMRKRGVSFKRAVNVAIRAALSGLLEASTDQVQPRSMGTTLVPLTKALQIAAELEDEEIVRKLSPGE